MHPSDTREFNENKVDPCAKQIRHREQIDCEVKSRKLRGVTDGVVGAF